MAEELALLFSPLHKRALGTAFGAVFGLVVFVLTVHHLIVQPRFNLGLLAEYFYGYTVTWQGAFIGLFWGFVAGFAGGWFLAFCRNLVITASMFVSRTRAELRATRDFLDHI